MGFRKLVEYDGSGMITLNKATSGSMDWSTTAASARGQDMHVQRIGRGAYLARAVEDGTVSELNGILRFGECNQNSRS